VVLELLEEGFIEKGFKIFIALVMDPWPPLHKISVEFSIASRTSSNFLNGLSRSKFPRSEAVV